MSFHLALTNNLRCSIIWVLYIIGIKETSVFKKLEEIKQMGAYSVGLWYGEGDGCDDSDIEPSKRKVVVLFTPVGCLGEVKILWKGIASDFEKFNLKKKPTKISNPPQEYEYKKDGYYIWGTESGVETIIEKPFFGKWE